MKHEMNHNKTTVENIVADLSVKLNQYGEKFQNIPTERHVVSAKLEEITKELAAIISTSEVICNDFTKKEYIRKRDELSAFELEVRDELVKQEHLKKTISDVIKDKGVFQVCASVLCLFMFMICGLLMIFNIHGCINS
jgi:phage-related tail protein